MRRFGHTYRVSFLYHDWLNMYQIRLRFVRNSVSIDQIRSIRAKFHWNRYKISHLLNIIQKLSKFGGSCEQIYEWAFDGIYLGTSKIEAVDLIKSFEIMTKSRKQFASVPSILQANASLFLLLQAQTCFDSSALAFKDSNGLT